MESLLGLAVLAALAWWITNQANASAAAKAITSVAPAVDADGAEQNRSARTAVGPPFGAVQPFAFF